MHKNILICVGITILFLGIGFQPALANEVSTTPISDVGEDCFECQPVNRVDLLKVKLLLIRFEVFTNFILSKFGHIPEIQEKCEEILVIFETFQEKFYDLKLGSSDWDFPIICAFIEIISTPISILFSIVVDLFFKYQNNPILFVIIWAILGPLDWLLVTISYLWEAFDCSLLQP